MRHWQKIAVVGATGAVGAELEKLLRERGWEDCAVRLFASRRSAGRQVRWCGREVALEALRPGCFAGCELAFFSAGAGVSREWVPAARAAGAVVVDNSSAFRLDADVPLVVPEVNGELLAANPGVVANPNCSTIILAMALAPLRRSVGLRRVVVSTYQAISGAGARALAELESQTRAALDDAEAGAAVGGTQRGGGAADGAAEPYAFNVFSHDSAVDDGGWNVEERKMALETQKLFQDSELAVVSTCLRVPVRRAHLESVAVETERAVSEEDARRLWSEAPGVAVVDDRAANRFPTSLRASQGDEVLVGRVRRDPSVANGRGLLFLCAGDQLRKGAALNAVQIAEVLARHAGEKV